MNLDHAIERLYALKVDTTTRDGDGTPHEKPHKPLLLLAVRGWSLRLQAVPGASCSGFPNALATPDHIPWCQELRDRFTARFEVVRKLNDRNSQGSAGVSPASSPSNAAKMAALPTNGPRRAVAQWRRRIALCTNHH
ncbi:MAG: hypothetical protein ACNA8L_03575 [Luteolibacter sp.]